MLEQRVSILFSNANIAKIDSTHFTFFEQNPAEGNHRTLYFVSDLFLFLVCFGHPLPGNEGKSLGNIRLTRERKKPESKLVFIACLSVIDSNFFILSAFPCAL